MPEINLQNLYSSVLQGAPTSDPKLLEELLASDELQNAVQKELGPQYSALDYAGTAAKRNYGIAKDSAALSKKVLGQDIGENIRQLKKQEAETQHQFINQQRDLGIRHSGLTDTGLRTIGKETKIAMSSLEANRANRLAEIALQNRSSKGVLSDALKEAELQRKTLDQQQSGLKLQRAIQAQEIISSPFLDQVPRDVLKQMLETYGFTVV